MAIEYIKKGQGKPIAGEGGSTDEEIKKKVDELEEAINLIANTSLSEEVAHD